MLSKPLNDHSGHRLVHAEVGAGAASTRERRRDVSDLAAAHISRPTHTFLDPGTPFPADHSSHRLAYCSENLRIISRFLLSVMGSETPARQQLSSVTCGRRRSLRALNENVIYALTSGSANDDSAAARGATAGSSRADRGSSAQGHCYADRIRTLGLANSLSLTRCRFARSFLVRSRSDELACHPDSQPSGCTTVF